VNAAVASSQSHRPVDLRELWTLSCLRPISQLRIRDAAVMQQTILYTIEAETMSSRETGAATRSATSIPASNAAETTYRNPDRRSPRLRPTSRRTSCRVETA
jgi:hypothetical protein